MSSPLISVVMPVYNESVHDLQESIDSILNQTYRNFEYIIVDDNPNNDTIKNYIKKRANQDNRIKLMFNKHNLKQAKSYNKGIKHSKGKYIARIDADDIAYNNRLESQLKFLLNNHLDFTCCNCCLIDGNDQIIQNHSFSTVTQCNQNRVKHVMSYCNLANGPTFFFNKSIFDKIKGYRNSTIDDYDFAARILIKNYRMGYQSDVLLKKRHRISSISNSTILNQFVSVLVLSKYLRKTNFTKVMPLFNITRAINNIRTKDQKKFKLFLKYRNNFKNNKSIESLLKAIFIMLSSKIILKRFLWGKFIGNCQNRLIRGL